MKILCIDASTSNFGLAYYEDRILKKVENIYLPGVYNFPKMRTLHFVFTQIIRDSEVRLVVFEQPVPMRYSKALTSINQAIGLLIGIFYNFDVEVMWIHNKTIKKHMGITEHGKDGKKQGIEIVKNLYPQFSDYITSDHIADAVMVGETYYILNPDSR